MSAPGPIVVSAAPAVQKRPREDDLKDASLRAFVPASVRVRRDVAPSQAMHGGGIAARPSAPGPALSMRLVGDVQARVAAEQRAEAARRAEAAARADAAAAAAAKTAKEAEAQRVLARKREEDNLLKDFFDSV